ncbi:alpha/beta fold hydrolase [Myxosarcina sp. GI1(2024)]
MSIQETTIQVGNLRWFYRYTEVESDRPTVLLLHGIPTHSYTWREVMNLLAAENLPAIAPDWIGCGFSDKPNKRDFAYTSEAFLTALTEFIDALQLEKFYLVVQGFLGSVGLQYALQHPEAIESLIILNTPLDSTVKIPWTMKQLSFPIVGDMMVQDPLMVDRTLEKGSGFVIADADLAVHRKPFLQTSAVGRALKTTIQKLELAKTSGTIETGLKQWQQPTLIIWGMSDPWLKTTDVGKLADSLTDARLVELPEAKHYPQEHWSKEIAAAIVGFFRRKVF